MLVRDRSPNHIAWLRWLTAHYRIYAELKRLELRAQKWQRPETIQQAIENAKECEVKRSFLITFYLPPLTDSQSPTRYATREIAAVRRRGKSSRQCMGGE